MNKILAKQKEYFFSGATKSVDFRIAQLKSLKEAISRKEKEIAEALNKDLGKSMMESYMTEFGTLSSEINYVIKNLRTWAKPKRVKTPLILFKAKSHIYPEPYGSVLIIGTWNYPILLSLGPLVGAIAAGNCAVVKPSEISPNCSRVIAKIVKEIFSENYIAVIEGNGEIASELLKERFDYIFYTGSVAIGKIVMEAAAKNLTPLTLELGGKSPCIVDKDIDIESTVRRIIWGKFINAGQTCVAPDYLLVHKKIKHRLFENMKKCLAEFYGPDTRTSPDYGRIVSQKHFDRLVGFLNKGKKIMGGDIDKQALYIGPTIIDEISWNDPIMQEEIFGPILPVITYSDPEEIIAKINERPKPLALYLFSNNKIFQNKIIAETSSGGACVNATIYHQISPDLPFGGVGNSGIGNYHGKATFDTFTHYKSVLEKSFRPDLKLAYPPYEDKLKLIKKIWK